MINDGSSSSLLRIVKFRALLFPAHAEWPATGSLPCHLVTPHEGWWNLLRKRMRTVQLTL